jgi:hypothetical protein
MSRIARASLVCALLALVCMRPALRASGPPGSGPFAFFGPWVAVSDSDRRRLDRDEVISRTVEGGDGQLSVFVASRLDAEPDALVVWMRAITELKRGRFVQAVGRFSDPPAVADLRQATLERRDVDDLRACRPGDCGLKLSADEIRSVRAVADQPEATGQQIEEEFRRLVVARVRAYRAGGLAALPPSADHGREGRRPADAFAAILARSPFLNRVPALTTWLAGDPAVADERVESFFYWSKEYYGRGRPVISVTHVGIVRSDDPRHPEALVAAKQIFATHYVEGALGLTAVVRDHATGARYLVYLNRSELDLLKGFLGGFARNLIEGRVKREGPQIVGSLRERLEGAPPGEPLAGSW